MYCSCKKTCQFSTLQGIWGKVFKNESSKICGRQPLKILLGPFLNALSRILTELFGKTNN